MSPQDASSNRLLATVARGIIVGFPGAARAFPISVVATYTSPSIVSGPLSLGLAALPASVEAPAIFEGPIQPGVSQSVEISDLLSFSLSLGDMSVDASALSEFAVTYLEDDGDLYVEDLG